MLVLFQDNKGAQSLQKCIKVHIWSQILVQRCADGCGQVDFGLTVPDTVSFPSESLIAAQSKTTASWN